MDTRPASRDSSAVLVISYNPIHDVCSFVVDAAATLAGRRRSSPPGVYDFPLAGPPTPVAAGHYARVLRYREHVRPVEEARARTSRPPSIS